jgi:hypothetical protein
MLENEFDELGKFIKTYKTDEDGVPIKKAKYKISKNDLLYGIIPQKEIKGKTSIKKISA